MFTRWKKFGEWNKKDVSYYVKGDKVVFIENMEIPRCKKEGLCRECDIEECGFRKMVLEVKNGKKEANITEIK